MKPSDSDRALEECLKILLPVPGRDPIKAAQGREAFLAEAGSLAHEFAGSLAHEFAGSRLAQPEARPVLFNLRRWQFAVIFSLFLLIVMSGGAVAAAQSSLPGDPLYGLKTRSEAIALLLPRSPEQHIDLDLDLADRRLQDLNNRQPLEPDKNQELARRYEFFLDDALQTAARLNDEDLPGTLSRLQRRLESQAAAAAMASPQVEALVSEKIRTRLAWVKDGQQDPQSYRQRIQNPHNPDPTLSPLPHPPTAPALTSSPMRSTSTRTVPCTATPAPTRLTGSATPRSTHSTPNVSSTPVGTHPDPQATSQGGQSTNGNNGQSNGSSEKRQNRENGGSKDRDSDSGGSGGSGKGGKP